MGSGITECQYRLELFQAFLCLLALNRLRFINNKHGVCLCNNVDRTAAAELIEFHIDTASVLALCIERLRVDYHDIDIAVTCKAVDLGEPCGIVDEKAYLLAVFLRKMLLRDLKRLIHALTDRNTRHDYDKLRPAVSLVQLIHGLDVGVGLADTCFHFDREVIPPLQLVRGLYLVCTLNFADTLQYHIIGQGRDKLLICPAREFLVCIGQACFRTSVHHVCRGEIGLSCEHVNNSFCRISLEFLVFKL